MTRNTNNTHLSHGPIYQHVKTLKPTLCDPTDSSPPATPPCCALHLPPAPPPLPAVSLGYGPVPSGESGTESKGQNGQTRLKSLEIKAPAPVRTPWPQAERASLCGWTGPVSGTDEEAAGHGWLSEQYPGSAVSQLSTCRSRLWDPRPRQEHAEGSWQQPPGCDWVHTLGSPAGLQEPSRYATGYGGLRALSPRGSEGVSLVL